MEIFDQTSETDTVFAELLLPVPIPKLFTYRIPVNLQQLVVVGQRAIVQFGDRKILTGIIFALHHQPPKEYEAKYILELLDNFPSVTEQQFKLIQWMADYYMCSQGEVMNAALPSGLKLSSESRVQLHPSFVVDESDQPFSDKELMLLRHLSESPLSYSEIAKLLGVKNIYTIIKSLVGKEAVILFEEIKDKYRPKTETKIRLTNDFNSPKALEKLFETLSSKPKQEDVILKYLQSVPVLQDPTINKAGISKRKFLRENVSASALNSLIKKNVFESFEEVLSRFGEEDENMFSANIQLSDDQKNAQNEILKSFTHHGVTLLHGITGSGKTEIYINLIKQALESGSQVLYLLPEIALTTQIVYRLKKIFGNAMGVYHSKFSDNERVDVWNGVLTGRFKFVAGVRSSVFLPFDNLGLIIVDEEHDASYKQQDPAPRYHARDVAVMMGKMHHAKVLLGSATPSVESYFLAKQQRYGLVTLHKRFGEAQLPSLVLADMAQERKQKTIKGEFSRALLRQIEEAIGRKEQAIIFQNRRGYSPMMNCEDCSWVPKCLNCAVSLTYHQYRHALVCHYCGYKESLPTQCPTCSSTRLKTVGYGTEKIEEELKLLLPDTNIQRMDLDTTRSKTGYETIIDQFEKGQTQILVGTQMVTKGLDFDGVSVVGIFNADRMIHFPDFRSYERAYQLITQVSGRAGRREKRGTVVIQTSNPEHPLLDTILKNDYSIFYQNELNDRHLHQYPPFSRLLEVTVKNADKKSCRQTATALVENLRRCLRSAKVLGPGEPVVSKIRNQYLMNILIKIPRGQADLNDMKANLMTEVERLGKEKEHRNSRIIIDVDPI